MNSDTNTSAVLTPPNVHDQAERSIQALLHLPSADIIDALAA
jgi:hypothetical protein